MDLKSGHHKDISLEEIELHVQKHVNYSKLNSQHVWRYLCDHLIKHETLHVDNQIRYSYELQKLRSK